MTSTRMSSAAATARSVSSDSVAKCPRSIREIVALADAGPPREIDLPPAAPDPDEADRRSEPLIAHARSVASGACLPLTPAIRASASIPGLLGPLPTAADRPRTLEAERRGDGPIEPRDPTQARSPARPAMAAAGRLATWPIPNTRSVANPPPTRGQPTTPRARPLHDVDTASSTQCTALAHAPTTHESQHLAVQPHDRTTTSCGLALTARPLEAYRRRTLLNDERRPSETPAAPPIAGPHSPERRPSTGLKGGDVAATARSGRGRGTETGNGPTEQRGSRGHGSSRGQDQDPDHEADRPHPVGPSGASFDGEGTQGPDLRAPLDDARASIPTTRSPGRRGPRPSATSPASSSSSRRTSRSRSSGASSRPTSSSASTSAATSGRRSARRASAS